MWPATPEEPIMSEETTAVVETAPETFPLTEGTPEVVVVANGKPAKKANKKSTTKVKAKPAKKPAKEKKTVTKTKAVKKAGRAPKEGLRTMQLRALDVLSDPANKDGLSLAHLAKKAKIGEAVMKRGLGPIDRDSIEGHEKTAGFRSLIGLGHVRVQKREYDEKTEIVFAISPSGLKAAERNREAIDALGKPHKAPYTVDTKKKPWWLKGKK